MQDLPIPRIGRRDLFPRLQARAYLSHAAISPPSLLVERAVQEALSDYATLGVGAFPLWAERREQLRGALGRLLQVAPSLVAVTPGATHSITQLAFGLPWRRGERVVLFRGEFPANVTPWQRAAEHFDLELDWLPLPPCRREEGASPEDPSGFVLEHLERCLRRGARLVAVSAVQFQTGLRMPLTAMAELCHRYGAELAVDGIQACGAVPLAVGDAKIDYLACGAHKWLLGVEGVGFTYVRKERAAALVPRLAGWLSHEAGEAFLVEGSGHLRYDRPFKPAPACFEGSSSNVLGLAALQASVGMLLELGVESIFDHVQGYLDLLEAGLTELGCHSVRARHPESRSCILSVQLPEGASGGAVIARLRQAGVAVSHPDGLVRFAPHFSNDLDEIPFVLEQTRRALRP